MNNNKQSKAPAKEALKPATKEVAKKETSAIKTETKTADVKVNKKHYKKYKKPQTPQPAPAAKKLTLWQKFVKWFNEPIKFTWFKAKKK